MADQFQALAPMGGDDQLRIADQKPRHDGDPTGCQMLGQGAGQFADRPGQDVFENQVIGARPAYDGRGISDAGSRREQMADTVAVGIEGRHAGGFFVDVRGDHGGAKQLCRGDAQNSGPAPHIQNARRPMAGRHFQQKLKTTGGRAMLARAEGRSRIKQDRHHAEREISVVMGAVKEKPANGQGREFELVFLQPILGRDQVEHRRRCRALGKGRIQGRAQLLPVGLVDGDAFDLPISPVLVLEGGYTGANGLKTGFKERHIGRVRTKSDGPVKPAGGRVHDTLSTKLPMTFLRPAFSKSISSLSPSLAVIRPYPNF